MKEPKAMLDCIVIGAGPGGLVCTKELVEQGLTEVVCLESSSQLGGTFSDTYDSLVLTSSAPFSMYSDFPIDRNDKHKFWTKAEAVEYWTRYADHFGVMERVRFGALVVKAERVGEGWRVETEDGAVWEARRLALAVGNNRLSRFPDWRAELSAIDCTHSKEYRNADEFAGKRVLIVGGGESASDVALEVARVADQAWVSLRSSAGWVVGRYTDGSVSDASTHRGLWGLPRSYGDALSRRLIESSLNPEDPVSVAVVQLNAMIEADTGIWGTYGTKTMSLPLAIAEHGVAVVGEIVEVSEGGATLTDAQGRTLTRVDAVIFCTGFRNAVDFMPVEFAACDPRSLFKHMLHPDLGDTLAWIGWARPGFGSQFPIMEMQARYFALVASGQLSLPDRDSLVEAAKRDEDIYTEQFGTTAVGVRSLVDYHRYMDGLAQLMGCSPPLARSLLTRPQLWLKLVYGPTQAAQFRLRGPGSKPALAAEIIAELPTSPFNQLVVEGLLGRFRLAVESALPHSVATRLPWWSWRLRVRSLRSRLGRLRRGRRSQSSA